MTRSELLAQLPPFPTHPTALSCAKLELSDAGIEQLARSLRLRKVRLGRSGVVHILGFVAFLIYLISFEPATPPAWLLSAGAAFFGVSLPLHLLLTGPLERLEQLKPLTEPSEYTEARALVESGGPDVAAWLRIAVAERQQLYRFDFNVMFLLAERYKAQLRAEQKKADLTLAQRALHEMV